MAAVAVAVGRPPRNGSARTPEVDFTIPAGMSAVPAGSTQDLLYGDNPDDAEESAAINAALIADQLHHDEDMFEEDVEDEAAAAEANEDIDPELCTSVVTFSSRSPMNLLRAERMFSTDLCEWDAKGGADMRQLQKSRYLQSDRLMFPSIVCEPNGALPPLVVELPPYLDGRIGCASELMDFMWPLAQAPVSMLISQCRTTMQYTCAAIPRSLENAQSVAEVSAALQTMAEDHPRGIMIRPELLMAPDFPHRSEAPAAYRHPFEKIWPIQSASMQRSSALLATAARGLSMEAISLEKVRDLFQRQLKAALMMMMTPTRGVDPTFHRLGKDLTELRDFVELGTNVAAETARAFFQKMTMESPSTTEFPEQRPMPLLSAILAQKTALVRGYLNVSAAQVEAFMPIEASGHGLGGDDFGQLQQTWLLKGPFDVGKSYVLDVLGTCVPPSMFHQSHHTTAGSRSLPEYRGFYMADEQQTNTTTNGRTNNRRTCLQPELGCNQPPPQYR